MTDLVLMVPFSEPISRLSLIATLLADSLNHLCWIRRPGRGVLNRGMLLLGHSGSSSSSFNHSSINVYISAVQSLHINNGLPDLLINCLQLQRLLRGVKRVQGSSSLNRLPISIDILHVVKRALNLYSRDHVMLWAASWLGFFGFLANLLLIHRLSRAFIWGLVMCRPIPWGILRVSQNSHQAFKDGSFWCWLWHLQVYIGRGNNTVCPVEALCNLLAVSGPSPGPLFCYTEGRSLTHQLLSSSVQSIP